MSDTNTTTTTAPATEIKPRRSYAITLHGADGAAMQVMALRRKNGTAQTFVIHSVKLPNGKRQNTRGASQEHPTMDAAVATVDRVAALAAEKGWVRRTAVGFTRKADAFTLDTLPLAGLKAALEAAPAGQITTLHVAVPQQPTKRGKR